MPQPGLVATCGAAPGQLAQGAPMRFPGDSDSVGAQSRWHRVPPASPSARRKGGLGCQLQGGSLGRGHGGFLPWVFPPFHSPSYRKKELA